MRRVEGVVGKEVFKKFLDDIVSDYAYNQWTRDMNLAIIKRPVNA